MKIFKRNSLIAIGLFFGIEIGWYISTGYVIKLIEKKTEVISLADYTRLRELESQIEKGRWLWF